MTVCIAAIGQELEGGVGLPIVLGMSDRMITVGDNVEYEPPQQKLFPIGKHGILIAGDTAVHASALQAIDPQFRGSSSATVRGLATAYGAEMEAHKQRDAELRILRPHGLTFETWRMDQRRLSPAIAERIAGELQRHDLGVEALVIGVDTEGPHIFVIDDRGILTSEDHSGFAAIGIGVDHASTHLTSVRYGRLWGVERALFHIYAAKRRAEISPGVGIATDLFYADTAGYETHGPDGGLIQGLKERYDELQVETEARTRVTERRVADLLRNRRFAAIDGERSTKL